MKSWLILWIIFIILLSTFCRNKKAEGKKPEKKEKNQKTSENGNGKGDEEETEDEANSEEGPEEEESDPDDLKVLKDDYKALDLDKVFVVERKTNYFG